MYDPIHSPLENVCCDLQASANYRQGKTHTLWLGLLKTTYLETLQTNRKHVSCGKDAKDTDAISTDRLVTRAQKQLATLKQEGKVCLMLAWAWCSKEPVSRKA